MVYWILLKQNLTLGKRYERGQDITIRWERRRERIDLYGPENMSGGTGLSLNISQEDVRVICASRIVDGIFDDLVSTFVVHNSK